ncbi:MAG: magnesium transporter, partial [Halanaerobiaceae bacterium]
VEIFSFMPADDVTDLMGAMPVNKRKQLLALMRSGKAERIKELLGYGPETAGGIMTKEYLALRESLNTRQAMEKIKEIGPRTEVIESIFVVNDKKELQGTVDLREVLSAADEKTLGELVEKNFYWVTPDVDQEEVARAVARYDLPVVPVVSRKKRLLGIITFDDIIDVIEDENTEDMLRMVGVEEVERVDSPLRKSIRRRLPWLFINLGTAFLAAFTVGLFEDVIAQVVALAVAMPIVAGMGGNAGTQTLSIVIRGLALGELEFTENWKIAVKEVVLGLIHGAAIGLVTGTILYVLYGNPYLGLIIFLAMIVNLIIAGLSGFVIPLGLKLVGADPALASAIFLTTVTDVFGFFVFLGLARFLLTYLL